MKRVIILLLLSLASLLLAASMQIGATGAVFSDKVISAGNSFQAADSW